MNSQKLRNAVSPYTIYTRTFSKNVNVCEVAEKNYGYSERLFLCSQFMRSRSQTVQLDTWTEIFASNWHIMDVFTNTGYVKLKSC